MSDNLLFQIQNISFSYENRPVIKDICLKIEQGHFYGILGPNGCGKSTFIDLLMGHQSPDSGEIIYQSKPLYKYSRKQLAREIALVPQNFYINFPFTGFEVVVMGRYPHMSRFSPPSAQDADIVAQIMESTGTDKFKDRYITEMSGGERQRVIFARALAQNTSILMLDEATSNLDIKHTLKLMDIVLNHVKQQTKTVIAVIQDINLAAAYCDQLILLKDGYVQAAGDTQNVLTEKNIKAVFDVDSHIFFDEYSTSKRVSFKRNA